jgi:chondroitin-sulfate-ABC endolyase/exolyase
VTKASLFILFLVLWGWWSPALQAQVAPATIDFEEPAAPAWTTGKDGTVTVSSWRFKSGKQSLLWEWRAETETLVFRNPAAFEKRAGNSAFGLWVYNQQPLATPLRAELLHGEEVVAACWFWIDYQGWRPLGATYSELGCKTTQAVDGLRFHAPQGVKTGQLHLDCVRCNFPLTDPSLARTRQMPWSGRPGGLKQAPAQLVLSDADISLNRAWLPERKPVAAITPEERQDMAKLAERLLPSLKRPARGLKPGTLDTLRKKMAEYQIHRQGKIITGRPVDSGSLVPPPGAIGTWELLKFCGEVQAAFYQAAKPEETAELKQMFVDLCAHYLDQGWTMGSQYGGWDNYPGATPDPFYLMRDVLAEAGLAREMALALTERFGCHNPGQYLAEKPSSSMDGLGFWNNQLLPCVLLLPDEAERLQHLRAVQRFYDLALTENNTLGPDGCSYHHGGFHFAYASYNLPRLVRVLKQTAGTGFRLAAPAHERLRTYARAIAFTFSGGEQAYNLGMRAGTPLRGDMGNFAAELAALGTPDGQHKLDEEMAALAIWSTLDLGDSARSRLGQEPLKSWIANGIKPAAPTGHLTMNGSPLAVHRRDGWLASIAGMSKYWRGLEIYGWTQSNNYGRFARNGSICVTANGTPPSLAASGWSYDGWNWSHFPGTTALRQNARELFDGYAMYGNGSAFAGGTNLGDDGIWAMEFTGGNGVKFNKSYFCFGNRITAITSDIQPDPKRQAPAITTLFQNRFKPGTDALLLDGERLADFPLKRTLTFEKPHWLIDNQGTGYLIPAGNNPVELASHEQEWLYLIRKYLVDPKNDPLPTNHDYQYFRSKHKSMADVEKCYRPSRGDFALAYFDHGQTSANATCAYTMVIKTTPDEMQTVAKHQPWQIEQRDGNAHVVSDTPSQTIGYALFKANEKLAAAGLLLANSQPCLVMLRREGATAHLSVVCPDIQRTQPIRLKLQGAWKSGGGNANLTITKIGNDTQVEVQPDYNVPIFFDLVTGP